MEYKSLSKLLVLIIFLGLLQGNIFAQDIQFLLKADSLACDTFPPPRNLDGIAYDHTIHLWWEKPEIDSITPNNLIGYNLYLNGDSNDYISYDGEDTSDYFDTVDFWFPPGVANYHVSAIYEMLPCGFPGTIEESQWEGAFSIWIIPDVFILDFEENWNTGSFEPNYWTADEYWYVDGPYGHPPPCATYSNFPDSAYSQELVSWWLDCKNQPTGDTTYLIGDFYLEFEVKLNHLPMSGTDYLDVKIIDSLSWHVLEQYSTDSGSFGWELHTINITDWAKRKLTRINFTAHGEDGANIHDWYFDNIKVYRKCNPPLDLHWVVFDEVMAWSPPQPHSSDKTQDQKELQGYRVYYDLTPLEFTTDTFHIIDTPFGYGPYYVVAVYEDCEPASNYIYGPQSVQEIPKETEITIFPNPCNANLSIHSSEPMQSVQVFNAQGVLLLDQECKVKMMDIDTSPFPSGIYYLRIQTMAFAVSRKIIIRH